jgi:drug/metabolite transporter (DMT)-like permease
MRPRSSRARRAATVADTPPRALDARTWLALAATVLFWGASFAAIRAALREFGPAHLVLFRFAIASLALALYSIAVRMPVPPVRDAVSLAGIGLIGVAAYQLALNYGEMTVSAGAASLIIASGPVFTAVFARVFLRERITALGWLGIGISFVGVALIALGESAGFRLSPGALLVVVAAVSTGAYNVLQKPFLRRYSALQVTACSIWGATLLLLVFSRGLMQSIRTASPEALLAVAFLGVFPAALSYVTWSYVLSRLPAATAASFLYSVPPLATLTGWLWLGEIPAPLSAVGGVICLGGIALVNRRGRSREVPE